MSLFAIADLHLSLGADKPMDIFPVWDGYVEKLEKNWRENVRPEDTVVACSNTVSGRSITGTFTDTLPGMPSMGSGMESISG